MNICPACGGLVRWVDDAWVCIKCGNEYFPEQFDEEEL